MRKREVLSETGLSKCCREAAAGKRWQETEEKREGERREWEM